MKSPLTAKQQALYSHIKTQIIDREQVPTLKELQTFSQAGSLNTISQHLKALERKGYIVRRKYAQRSIELREVLNHLSSSTISIPVAGSVGCDDLSIFPNEEHDEFIEVDKKVLKPTYKYIAVRAVGNSMNDADIHDGDYVLVELTENVSNGDRVVVTVGGMITVKRFEKQGEIIILRPESTDPKYKPIIVRDDFKITGKVAYVIPNESRDMTRVIPIHNQDQEMERSISF